MQLPFNLL